MSSVGPKSAQGWTPRAIWRGLRRWEKSTDELRKQNEQCRAEISPGLDATSQMLEDVGRRLDASTARLGEQLAKSRA